MAWYTEEFGEGRSPQEVVYDVLVEGDGLQEDDRRRQGCFSGGGADGRVGRKADPREPATAGPGDE